MANSFSKEERVAFEDILEGFDDALVLSRACSKYRIPDTTAARTEDTGNSAYGTIWRPMPYIATSGDGADATSDFQDYTQLSVPARLSYYKHSAWKMTASELRDALQEGRLGYSAKQKLASDVNVSLMSVAANQGTIVTKVLTASSTNAPLAIGECDAQMNEIGVQMYDRYLALSSRDYNGFSQSLANKEWHSGDVSKAWKKSYIGDIVGFESYKLDYANRLAAATAGSVTINGANQYHTPVAIQSSSPTTAERLNVDNRYQNLAVTVGSNTIAVGDCFTIAGVNSVHLITKQDTGQLKTFRVTSLLSSGGATGTIQISPPIISNGGSTDAEAQYKNVTATPANGAAITFLNTAAAPVNPFWQKDALEILPGRLAIPSNAGVAVMRGTTDQGMEIVMSKFADIDTNNIKYRVDVLYGVVNKQPEMSGILLLNQT